MIDDQRDLQSGSLLNLPPTVPAPARSDLPRLRSGALGFSGAIASTMANIGPAMSFFFGFALIATTAGVASPLTVIVAAVGIAFVGNTLAEFSKVAPSTGSWVTFIGKGLGPVMATVTAVTYLLALAPGAASLLAIQGGWLSTIFKQYLGVDVPWQALAVALTGVVFLLVVRGIGLSTKAAGALFAFEFAVLVGVSVSLLAAHGGHLSAAPFDPSHLAGGWKGLGLGFPLAIYMFIGWENSAALAEETDRPRRNVPRAIYGSIAIMFLLYVLLAYATVVGSGYNAAALGNASVPFITVARTVLGGGVLVAYLAGFTSIMSSVIAAVNAQARVVFSAGREGVLPSPLGRVTRRYKTPAVALAVYLVVGLAVCLGWGWHLDPVTFYDEAATLATVPLLLIYIAVNASLIAYFRRSPQHRFSPLRHLAFPLAGIAVVVFPLYELAKPGQPSPYGLFLYVTLGFVAVSLIYALRLRRRDPQLAGRIGSVIADES